MTDRSAPRHLVRRPLTHELLQLADMHITHLPHGLFPRLGRAFMRRWYLTFLDSPYGVAYVVEIPGAGIRAFLVGSTDQHKHVAYVIRRHRLELGWFGVQALAARPAVLADFVRTRARRYTRRLLRPAGSPVTTVRSRSEQVAVVAAVAVDDVVRGEGLGTALMEAFDADARAAGAHRADLVTLAGTEGAGLFYRRLGWTSVGMHWTRDGDLVATFRKPTRPGEPSSAAQEPPGSGQGEHVLTITTNDSE